MKRRTKKIALGVIGICLVAAVCIGGTLAYLTRETEKRANNFTFVGDDALNAMLTEPDWDGIIDYAYNADGSITPIYAYLVDDSDPENVVHTPVYGYEDGDISKPVTDKGDIDATTDRPRFDSEDDDYKAPVYGDEAAVRMIPGASALKNPVITNTGEETDAWVAAKITFVYAEGSAKAGQPLSILDLAALMDVVEIDYKTDVMDKWERVEGTNTSLSQVFYYKTLLEKGMENAPAGVYGEVTAPIFTSVTVKGDTTNAQIAALEAIGGFAIYIEGFAVQGTLAENYGAFKTWGLDDGVVFSNTPTETNPADVSRPGIVPAQ